MALEILVEVQFPVTGAHTTGTERYSLEGASGKTTHYDARVLEFGNLSREIPIIPGDFRSASTTVVLDNTDNHFSKLRGSTTFYNTTVRLLLGDLKSGEADFTELFAGVVRRWGFRENEFELEVVDNRLVRLDTEIGIRIDTSTFGDLPNTTRREIVPFVIGTVSSVGFTATGAIPAYLVDPAVGQAKYRYVASTFALKFISKVYKYGVEVVSGFAVSQVIIGSQEYTVIDFDADQRDTTRSEDHEVTYDAIGITDDGLPSGNAITNPSDQLKEFLLKHGFVSGDLDLTSFTTCQTEFNTRNYIGGVAVTGDRQTIREVLLRFCDSFNIYFYTSRDGKLGISCPTDAPASTAGLVELRHDVDIGRRSLQISNADKLATAIRTATAPNFSQSRFGSLGEVRDIVEELKIGVKLEDRVSMWYTRDATTSAGVAEQRLFFMREERQLITLEARLSVYKTIDIGQNILLTHFEGVATDQKGYDKAVMRVLGVGLRIRPLEITVSLRMVDLAAQTVSGFDEFADFGIQSSPFWTSRENQRNFPGGGLNGSEEPIFGVQRGWDGY